MISVTKRAAEYIKKELEKRQTPNQSIRFGIRGGGCTGFSYVFEYDNKLSQSSDHKLEFYGVNFIIDAKSMIYLNGTEIDFETGIQGHGFKFNNPNAKSTCGCGESISF